MNGNLNKLQFKVQKSSALLMILLIITILGAVALTLSRSVIAGVGFTVNVADSISAEQASQAGLEYGLLRYKQGIINQTFPTIDLGGSTAEVKISMPSDMVIIESTGRAGSVVKKYVLTQSEYIVGTSPFTGTYDYPAPDMSLVNPADQVLYCKPNYVAVGTGHTLDPGCNPYDKLNPLCTRQIPWLKCAELVPQVKTTSTTQTWSGTGPGGDHTVSSGDYVVTASGHFKSELNSSRGLSYYAEWPEVIWSKLQGAILITSNPKRIPDLRRRIQLEQKIECPRDYVMIGNGHDADRFGVEGEVIYCAPSIIK